MQDDKFKTYLITNIPESDWKKFKKWTTLQDFNTLNDALRHIIKTAGHNKLAFYSESGNEHTT
tara:strand:- start:1925 stop:2113 length:189 start_codon:yes stop_codon:yes gene_type:complete